MTELKLLKRGARADAVRALQAATNRRLAARGLSGLKVREDGVLGSTTLRAVRTAAWALGALRTTLDTIASGTVPIGVQRMIRNPGRRNDRQKALGKVRIANMRKQRKRRAAATQKHGARGKAVNAFLAQVGTTESPPGSNGGGLITVMESYWGFGKVPWCGIAAGYFAKKYGGMVGLRSDVASVQAITNHAKAGRSPYNSFQSSTNGALPGSFIIIGGPGTHVGMVVEARGDGSADTVEGNTSFGSSGSQSNGGCIAKRWRSSSEIYGVATMNYPG